MEQYRYDFSVVMAVYNVENYIREAVESLVHQTIGFDRVQLILVDDGSTDKSGIICDEYGKKYPENVMVIHKENGRQASARNAGLPYTKGKYVNFLDPDDTLDADVMEKVKAFMDTYTETDVCSIPYFKFGNEEGPHVLNYKYQKGTRVIDLLAESEKSNIQLHASSAFFRHESILTLTFDTSLQTAEDAKLLMEVFMNNPKLGVVSDTKYNYRRHGNSTLMNCRFQKRWYSQQLLNFYKWALDTAQERFGVIPRFIQYTVMYDLQGRIKQKQVQPDILSADEAEEYRSLLLSIAARIDTDIIRSMEHISDVEKFYVICQKGKLEPKAVQEDIVFSQGTGTEFKLSEFETVLEFLTFKDEKCILEGYHALCGIGPEEVQPCVFVNGSAVNAETIERRWCARYCLGEIIADAIGFRVEIPLDNRKITIQPAIRYMGVTVKKTCIQYGKYFPLTGVYKNSVYTYRKYAASVHDSVIDIRLRSNSLLRMVNEIKLLHEIWKKNLLGGRKAVAGRLYYHIMKSFKRRQLWIVSDRIMKADDNGEILFKYIRSHQPSHTRVVFAISEQSPDYERLRNIGECVDAMSFRHKLMHLLCDINISAQADDATLNPYAGHDEALRDLLCHQKFVFLQHGIIKEDISGWLNRYNKNFTGFVTAAEAEYQSIIDGDYLFDKNTVWLTGLPRFDDLYHDEKKVITVMPTWREYLMVFMDRNSGVWTPSAEFTSSKFYSFYDQLLNSDKLLTALEETGYRLQFFPHPNLQPAAQFFRHNSKVEFLPLNTSYRKVYAESNLVVTDFSSAVFDFAYLRKPVIYCHFDEDTVLGGNHVYKKGYFSYERDGFGEVVYELDSAINLIIDYVRNDCRLKELYRRRIDRFFTFDDQDNSKRVLEKIMELN